MTIIKIKQNNYSTAYRFTVDSKDDPTLKHLRSLIKENNKLAKSFPKTHPHLTLRLFARGERVKWATKNGHSRRAYDQYLPHKYGTSFDVYVYPKILN